MDAVNNPRTDTTTPTVLPTQSLGDFDTFTFEQMGLSPGWWEPLVLPPSSALVRRRRGGGRDGGRGRGGSGSGGGARAYYSREESIVVAKAWEAITMNAVVGTDQMEAGFWARVLEAYNELKPEDAAKQNEDQIRKKWGWISAAVKRFSGIYENNLRTAESGHSDADIRAISYVMHRACGNQIHLLGRISRSPKFKAICEGAGGSAQKRTKLGLARNYSSSSDSHSIDLNEEVEEEPHATFSCR